MQKKTRKLWLHGFLVFCGFQALMGVGPALPGGGVGHQGDGEGDHGLHLLLHQALDGLRLRLGALHDQLVVDLKDQAALQPLGPQAGPAPGSWPA